MTDLAVAPDESYCITSGHGTGPGVDGLDGRFVRFSMADGAIAWITYHGDNRSLVGHLPNYTIRDSGNWTQGGRPPKISHDPTQSASTEKIGTMRSDRMEAAAVCCVQNQ